MIINEVIIQKCKVESYNITFFSIIFFLIFGSFITKFANKIRLYSLSEWRVVFTIVTSLIRRCTQNRFWKNIIV